jgi:hypothetical protein
MEVRNETHQVTLKGEHASEAEKAWGAKADRRCFVRGSKNINHPTKSHQNRHHKNVAMTWLAIGCFLIRRLTTPDGVSNIHCGNP